LLPLKDAITRATRDGVFDKLVKDGKLELAPMGLMRGRTFDDCYIVADEMQNSTVAQMKMVLMRTGERSKMVVTGDLSQSDLRGQENGLHNIHEIFDKIGQSDGGHDVLRSVRFVQLRSEDVQRSAATRDVSEFYRRGAELLLQDHDGGRDQRHGRNGRHGRDDRNGREHEEEPLVGQHEPRPQLPLFSSSFRQKQEHEDLDV
jgi:phosphate starvation-inducible PhoH-like protein